MNRARNIEKVELDFFLRKSKDRLGDVKHGTELFEVIDKQKMKNSAAISGMNVTR